MQDDVGFAASRARHFDIEPPHSRAPTSSERFHYRLLGGETTGIAFVFSTHFSLAVRDFPFGKHPVPESPANSSILQRFLDPLDFNQIYPGAYDHPIQFAPRP